MNPELKLVAAADWTLLVETTCLNRDLPARLPLAAISLISRSARARPWSVASLA